MSTLPFANCSAHSAGVLRTGSKAGFWGPSNIPHASGTALRYLTIEILCFVFPVTNTILLRDVKLAEHVLIKRILNVDFDPIQADHALLKLRGKFSVNRGGSRDARFHFRNDGVGPTARLRVIVRT